MSKHPQVPHLFSVALDGLVVAVVRAMSGPEARDYFLDQRLALEKLTPSRAFQIAGRCEFGIDNAKPDYADPDDATQHQLFAYPPPADPGYFGMSSIDPAHEEATNASFVAVLDAAMAGAPSAVSHHTV